MIPHYCKKHKGIPYEIVVNDKGDEVIRIDIFDPSTYKRILESKPVATINFGLPFFDKPIIFTRHKEEIVSLAEHEIDTIINLKKI